MNKKKSNSISNARNDNLHGNTIRRGGKFNFSFVSISLFSINKMVENKNANWDKYFNFRYHNIFDLSQTNK